MKSPILKIENLYKSFGAVKASDNLNLNIYEKEIHALIGPNGSGKSTLVKQISGFLKHDSGHIFLKKENIGKYSPEIRARKGIARSFQISSVIENFRVIDNVKLSILGRKGHFLNIIKNVHNDIQLLAEAQDLLDLVELRHEENNMVYTLSHGDKRKLEICLALSLKPKLFLFDEPMAGLDDSSTKAIISLFKKLKFEAPILLIEHDMDSVFKLSDRISVLDYGKIIAHGYPDQIKKNKKVQEVYLGIEKV